jgi:hypothetical protein
VASKLAHAPVGFGSSGAGTDNSGYKYDDDDGTVEDDDGVTASDEERSDVCSPNRSATSDACEGGGGSYKRQEYDYSHFKTPVEVSQTDAVSGERGVYFCTDVAPGTSVVFICCKDEAERARNHVPIAHFYDLPLAARNHAIQVDKDTVCTDGAEMDGGDDNGVLMGINFINHSCTPSTWFAPRTFMLQTCRQVRVGEELTFDYATVDGGHDGLLNMPCHCGTAACRKLIRADDYLHVPHDHVSPFIHDLRSVCKAMNHTM